MEYYKSLGATDRRTDGHWLSVTLDSPQQQQQHQEKGWLMVMADPSDIGHGKNIFGLDIFFEEGHLDNVLIGGDFHPGWLPLGAVHI